MVYSYFVVHLSFSRQEHTCIKTSLFFLPDALVVVLCNRVSWSRGMLITRPGHVIWTPSVCTWTCMKMNMEANSEWGTINFEICLSRPSHGRLAAHHTQTRHTPNFMLTTCRSPSSFFMSPCLKWPKMALWTSMLQLAQYSGDVPHHAS
jgi:hypothetical protein